MINTKLKINFNGDFQTVHGNDEIFINFSCENSKQALLEKIIDKIEDHLKPENLIKNNDFDKKEKLIQSIIDYFQKHEFNIKQNNFSFNAGGYNVTIETLPLQPNRTRKASSKLR